MMVKGNDQRPDWESQLRQGLDALSDTGQEEPPNVADLQMLVASVQAEQRQQLRSDLLKFWGVGVLLLTLALAISAQRPIYFIAWQGIATLLLIAWALAWRGGKKRVTE